MRAYLLFCLLAGNVFAQTVTTVTTTLPAGAQSLPTDADVAQVMRALAIVRGTPAIVPLTEGTSVPLPTPVPIVVVPQPVPVPVPDVVSSPPLTTPLDAPAMGVRVRRSFPFGSLATPKNVRGF